MRNEIDDLVSLIAAMRDARRKWEPYWNEVIDLIYKKRGFYAPTTEHSDRKPDHRYSSKALRAWTIAARGFQGYTADRASEWAKLQFEDPSITGSYMVQDWLELVQRILMDHFSRAGFYEALSEMIPDGMNLGNGSIYTEENLSASKIMFRCRHPFATYFAQNAYGETDIAVDEEWLSYRGAAQRFGKKRLHDVWQRNADERPMDSAMLVHVTMPMDDRYLQYSDGPKLRTFPFISIWLDEENRHIVDVGVYWEFPYLAWRFDTNDGESYGRGPGMYAVDDTYIANQMTKSRIALGQLISNPPKLVSDELRGKDSFFPGSAIYKTKAESTIEPIQLGANYPITVDNEERIEAAIDDIYNVPIYRMLQEADRKQRTATEVIEMVGERVSVLSPTVGQYERQVLQPGVRRAFNLLMRAGMLPKPPPAVVEAFKAKQPLKVEFVGRLSQMSRRFYKSDGTNTALSFAMAMKDVFPESLDNLDQDELMRQGLEAGGAPATLVREKEDVIKIRTERIRQQQELMQKQEAMAQQQNLMQNIDKLGKRPEEGSPAADMNAWQK